MKPARGSLFLIMVMSLIGAGVMIAIFFYILHQSPAGNFFR